MGPSLPAWRRGATRDALRRWADSARTRSVCPRKNVADAAALCGSIAPAAVIAGTGVREHRAVDVVHVEGGCRRSAVL
jgi:hypothetical protein